MNKTMETITARRSIRRYTRDPVTEEVLHDILQAARWAPSWANTQCLEIVVVNDPEIKEKLQGILSPKNPAGEILQLPEDVEVVTLIPLEYPDHEPGPPQRRAVVEFVHYNTF